MNGRIKISTTITSATQHRKASITTNKTTLELSIPLNCKIKNLETERSENTMGRLLNDIRTWFISQPTKEITEFEKLQEVSLSGCEEM